jgi:hypothetical protein
MDPCFDQSNNATSAAHSHLHGHAMSPITNATHAPAAAESQQPRVFSCSVAHCTSLPGAAHARCCHNVAPKMMLCHFARSSLVLLGLLSSARDALCSCDACRHTAGVGHAPTKPGFSSRSACSSVETSHLASARTGPRTASSAHAVTDSTALTSVTAMHSSHSTMVRDTCTTSAVTAPPAHCRVVWKY